MMRNFWSVWGFVFGCAIVISARHNRIVTRHMIERFIAN